MTTLLPGLYVRIVQATGERPPQPLPLSNGFSEDTAYLALGLYSPSETSEAYLILSNDRDEMWFISNRHLRTDALRPASTAFRLPRSVAAASGDGAAQPADPAWR